MVRGYQPLEVKQTTYMLMAERTHERPTREDITLIRKPPMESPRGGSLRNPQKHLRRKNGLWIQMSVSKQLCQAQKT